MLSFLPLIAAVSAANNAFTNPVHNITLNAGDSLDIKWANASGPTADLLLRTGDSNNLKTVKTVANGIDNQGEYKWTVPKDLESGSYALEIKAGGEDNYTPFFTIVGDAKAAAAHSSSVSPRSSAAANSSSVAARSSSVAARSSAAGAAANASANATSTAATSTSASPSKSSAAGGIVGGAGNSTGGVGNSTGGAGNSTGGAGDSTGAKGSKGSGSSPSGSKSTSSGSPGSNGASMDTYSKIAIIGAIGVGALLL